LAGPDLAGAGCAKGWELAERRNELGQAIGEPVPEWVARQRPPRLALAGTYCIVEPLDAARHAVDLHAAYQADETGRLWTYLPYGPFADEHSYRAWATQAVPSEDPLFHAIVDRASGRALGIAAYLRIDPGNGVIEVGHIVMSPALQRSVVATEAMYLLARRAFDELGYRRYEWKCDALNAPSRAAAQRLGFRYEGCFRQAIVYKGRNRDTAWFAITDRDWPSLRGCFERWLDLANFDEAGQQRMSLSRLTADSDES
jgi:RimJ/RimL family protein N-acetyltransferase